MSKIHNIKDYTIRPDDTLFFDNNVWMYLFSTIGNSKKNKQRIYSAFLQKVLSRKTCIWINSLILSEFCNAWLKFEFNNWIKLPENISKTNYKLDFIPSDHYKNTISQIKNSINDILKITEKCSDDFTSININSIFSELENCGFNDSYYLELAQKNKWKIVTDDSDFIKNTSLNVEIITDLK